MAVVVLGMGEEGSNGDIVGVGNAAASAGAHDRGGDADDGGGSHFSNDHEGRVVGEAISVVSVAGAGLVMIELVLVLTMGVGGDAGVGEEGGSVGDSGGTVWCW